MHPGEQTQHDDDEEAAGDVERADQQAQRADRLDAVAADGERHGAERTERREPHDEAEGREQHVGEAVDAVEHRLAGAADARQPKAAKDRQQQHRQHLAFGKGAEERHAE